MDLLLELDFWDPEVTVLFHSSPAATCVSTWGFIHESTPMYPNMRLKCYYYYITCHGAISTEDIILCWTAIIFKKSKKQTVWGSRHSVCSHFGGFGLIAKKTNLVRLFCRVNVDVCTRPTDWDLLIRWCSSVQICTQGTNQRRDPKPGGVCKNQIRMFSCCWFGRTKYTSSKQLSNQVATLSPCLLVECEHQQNWN